MSNPADPSGFGKFVPGFDFLQKLAQGGNAQMAGWLAPTLDAAALDKRIDELKAVQFWLDQNAAALKATIQALEVQKMTLATLKNMNVPLPGGAGWPQAAAPTPEAPAAKPRQPRSRPQAPATATAPVMPDPMQFWGALTQQFQQIASQAMQEVAKRGEQAPPVARGAPSPSAPAPTKRPAARSRRKS